MLMRLVGRRIDMDALESAIRMVKEGGMKGIKLEGGAEMAPTIRKISQAGIL
jgi:3-methyl-2-oxobutanoate hydroxymethyltransferase